MLADQYKKRVESGEITADPTQDKAVQALVELETRLSDSHHKGMLSHILKPHAPPKGIYLWGPVGRGKSMLMDMFCADAPIELKRRVHFHAFMAEVQDRLEAKRRESGAKAEDLVPSVAADVAAKTDLLCFDELEVIDIADAMILGRLFEALFDRGLVLVATSNEAPDDLYKDGINRQLFMPFIELIKANTQVIELAGEKDYRTGREAGKTYFSPLDEKTSAGFDAAWRAAIAGAGESRNSVEVHGRHVEFDRTTERALRATFAELCERDLGPEDYLAIAKRFPTVFIEGVPILRQDMADQARRFVLLVDALYEAKTAVVLLVAAEPDQLFEHDDEATRRTASRLNEMRSAGYGARESAPSANGPSAGEA